MDDIKAHITELLSAKSIGIPANREKLFGEFINDDTNIKAIQAVLANQHIIMSNWELQNKIADILQSPCMIPNGTVGKPYEATLDFEALQWQAISHFELEGLEGLGLGYDEGTRKISGLPVQSGDVKLTLRFRVDGEAVDSILHEKKVPLVINPDPKSLWKNMPGDQNDPYWKADDAAESGPLGDRHIVVASKRGRSHANVGSFRDDDYAFKYFDQTGWSIVAVADGAGSARLSRKGSQLACRHVLDYFEQHLTGKETAEFDMIVQQYHAAKSDETEKTLELFLYKLIGNCAFDVNKHLEQFAESIGAKPTDLNTTLIFALFKKYDFGYVFLTFGVGDCPIGILNKDLSEIKLMNWLDVGEFGGGTRFITTSEIFKSEKFGSRIGFKIMDDFSYLMLMTDGIYDPKFEVEASLEKLEKWKIFLSDLQGDNNELAKVEFSKDNQELHEQLSRWMDFWSPGNHDDRTLAIVF